MEFRQVYEQGERRSTSLCTIFFRPNGRAETRLGVTVPSRVGGAVLRNRIKRRVREVFRQNKAAFADGWDVVVNPRKEVATVAYPILERQLLRLFPKRPSPATGEPTRSVG
jgi:ribonuclease P protein component